MATNIALFILVMSCLDVVMLGDVGKTKIVQKTETTPIFFFVSTYFYFHATYI